MLALTVTLYLVGGTPLRLRPQTDHASPDQLSAKEAVDFLRTINTAELEFSIKKNRYVCLDELTQHRFLQGFSQVAEPASDKVRSPDARQNSNAGSLVKTDSSSGTLRNYKIFVVASADGKHYQAGIVPTESGCGWAVFSNESGVIYPAMALGCPAGDSPPNN